MNRRKNLRHSLKKSAKSETAGLAWGHSHHNCFRLLRGRLTGEKFRGYGNGRGTPQSAEFTTRVGTTDSLKRKVSAPRSNISSYAKRPYSAEGEHEAVNSLEEPGVVSTTNLNAREPPLHGTDPRGEL